MTRNEACAEQARRSARQGFAEHEARPLVDWPAYARQYDLMAENNPAYQELLDHAVRTISGWGLGNGDTIADFGAGTGNFSIAIAQALPNVNVLHVELNDGMIAFAQAKAAAASIHNWQVVRLDLTSSDWPIPELAGIVSVHALYAIPQPQQVIAHICAKIKPGGRLYAADFGRLMNVADWGKYLIKENLRRHGLLKTCLLFARSGIVRRENRHIAECQRAGHFWLHDLAEFRAAFEQYGMKIEFASNEFYRGCDDLIVCRKNSV